MKRPMVISDSLDSVQSMISGERFDSKSRLRQHYRANGATEVGNDISATMDVAAQKPDRPKISRSEIKQALSKVRNGYRPNISAD